MSKKTKNNLKMVLATVFSVAIVTLLVVGSSALAKKQNLSAEDKVALTAGQIVGSGMLEDIRDGYGDSGFNLAAASPDFMTNYISFGGVRLWAFSDGTLNQASSTACTLRAPLSATSTLQMASIVVTGGLTGDIQMEIGKSSNPTATSTSLGLYTAAAGSQFTMHASTTPESFTGGAPSVDQDWVFGPGEYLVFNSGSSTATTLAGRCKAVFIEN